MFSSKKVNPASEVFLFILNMSDLKLIEKLIASRLLKYSFSVNLSCWNNFSNPTLTLGLYVSSSSFLNNLLSNLSYQYINKKSLDPPGQSFTFEAAA